VTFAQPYIVVKNRVSWDFCATNIVKKSIVMWLLRHPILLLKIECRVLLRHPAMLMSCCRYRPDCTVRHSWPQERNQLCSQLRQLSALRLCLVSAIHEARSDVTQLCSAMASLESGVTRVLHIGTGYVTTWHDSLQPHITLQSAQTVIDV
jgi:hypothetical protein